MAARESQGLQIALIIFVGLTLILGVLTFIYFRNYEDQLARSKDDKAARQKAEDNLRTVTEEFNQVKSEVLGVASEDTLEKILEIHKKDMDAHGANFPESKRKYRNLVEYLHIEILNTANQRVVDTEAREKALQAKIEQDRTERTKELAKYDESLKKVQTDFETESAKFKKSEEQILAAKGEVAKVADLRGKDLDAKTKLAAETENKLKAANSELAGRVTAIKDKYDTELVANQIPDGRITWVSQRAKTVYLTLGSADGLRRQIVFSVLGEDANNPVKDEKKGSVEITRILGEHQSEARIVDDELSNPIMVGDRIFSQVWQPGQALRFGLAGFMDIDGDGTSDRKRVREIIVQNGGLIDAEVADDGKRTGAMTINTHYLVLGDHPLDKATKSEKGNPAAIAYNEVELEAKTLPVKRINVADFLDLMGYRAEERTIGLGNRANAKDFKPRLPDGVQRKSENNMFPPRRETPTAGRKSAF